MLDTGNHDLLATKTLDYDIDDDDSNCKIMDQHGHDYEDYYNDRPMVRREMVSMMT